MCGRGGPSPRLVAALIPRDVASTLWRIATTTEPIVSGGPAGVLSALEQLPGDMVEEVRLALGGHLPEIQVPPIGGLFGPESLPHWMGGIDDSQRAPQTSVLESARYVCEVAPQRVPILLHVVQHLMPQLLRDARERSDEDRYTRQLAAVVIGAAAVTTRRRISGPEADQAAIGLGLGTTVVLAPVQTHLAARTAPVAGSANAAPPNRLALPTMVGHSAADSRIIFSDLASHRSHRLSLFDGLDIHDNQDKVARGLVVIERFTAAR